MRNASAGWEVYSSDTEEKHCYHTCKSRFCPSCGYRATLLWLEEQEAALPDIPYTGVVFTMPRELWPVFKRNRHLLHDLPALAAGVIQQWISRKYGARALIMVVPHTFGGDLKFNSHIHLLVSAGGFEESNGHWIPRLSLNKDALMKMWRFAVISHLRRALKSGVLESNLNIGDMRSLLSNAYKSERHPRWIIFLETIVSKAHFLRYAARYVRRPPIAKWRLLKVTNTDVEFVAKDTKAGLLVPTRRTLPEFIRLLAAHVFDHYRHGIRYFGLLAPRAKRFTYAALSVFLGQTRRSRPRRLSWRSSTLKYFGFDPLIDSRGQEMHWVRRESVIAR